MVQEQPPPPAEAAEGPGTEERYASRLGQGTEERYAFRLGIYGWRQSCLYLLVLLLLSILVINFALTVWILRITCLNTEGMGPLGIRADGLRLRGVSEFLFPLFAQEIHSRQESSLVIHSEYQNVSIQSNNGRGGVSSSLILGPHSIETTSKHFEVISDTGALLFSAGPEQSVVGAGKLTVTGSDGVECDHSIETPLVRAVASQHLRLEAPTRPLYMDAPKGVHITAESGRAEAQSSMDISLLSLDGVVSLDAEKVRLPSLPLSPQGGSADRGTALGDQRLYEVCGCPDGRLYISKAGPNSTCLEYAVEC